MSSIVCTVKIKWDGEVLTKFVIKLACSNCHSERSCVQNTPRIMEFVSLPIQSWKVIRWIGMTCMIASVVTSHHSTNYVRFHTCSLWTWGVIRLNYVQGIQCTALMCNTAFSTQMWSTSWYRGNNYMMIIDVFISFYGEYCLHMFKILCRHWHYLVSLPSSTHVYMYM